MPIKEASQSALLGIIFERRANIMNNKKITAALIGNPNVGKSTLFNILTGKRQHTGNWAGKTVENAGACFKYKDREIDLVDLPGTYSLTPSSPEEIIARDYICFNKPDILIAVCDASLPERGIALCLKAMEMSDKVIICFNLMDEARRKGIIPNCERLSEILNTPVIPAVFRRKIGVKEICDAVIEMADKPGGGHFQIKYTESVEKAVKETENILSEYFSDGKALRLAAIQLLSGDNDYFKKALNYSGKSISEKAVKGLDVLISENVDTERTADNITSCVQITAEGICADAVTFPCHRNKACKADKILTGKYTAYPMMILMLAVVMWITVSGANYPSSLLSDLFNMAEVNISSFLYSMNIPETAVRLICEGVLRTVFWVVSVMLPPMAIFFPLFALLEDVGVLPRLAFNLDRCLKKAGACGKQALSMCMSLGCNACGVTGARIIDSKRERLIAILTASLMPCNGKFPTLITIMTIFFIGIAGSGGELYTAVGLTTVLIISVAAVFGISKLLSKTILKGEPSWFTLELTPYRVPSIPQILKNSFLEKTVPVLLRALAMSAPAGLIIWLTANISIGDNTILEILTGILNPVGTFFGLDGVILLGFILGFPANEIVVPIIIMAYSAAGGMSDLASLEVLQNLLTDNGWTVKTAACMLCFTLFHFPCSTSCITIYKETNSLKWTAVGFVLPLILGLILCLILNTVLTLFGF